MTATTAVFRVTDRVRMTDDITATGIVYEVAADGVTVLWDDTNDFYTVPASTLTLIESAS